MLSLRVQCFEPAVGLGPVFASSLSVRLDMAVQDTGRQIRDAKVSKQGLTGRRSLAGLSQVPPLLFAPCIESTLLVKTRRMGKKNGVWVQMDS